MLYLYVLPVGELAQVQGSVLDVVADRLLGDARGRHHGRRVDRQHRGEHQRDDVRRAARLLRDGARRRVLPGGGAACIRAIRRRPWRSSRRRWSGVLVLSGGASALTNYTGFAVVLFAGVAVAALFVLRHARAGRAASVQGVGLSGGAGDLQSRAWRLSSTLVERSVGPDPARASWGPSAAGLLIIVGGIPIYWWTEAEPQADARRCATLSRRIGTRLSSPV